MTCICTGRISAKCPLHGQPGPSVTDNARAEATTEDYLRSTAAAVGLDPDRVSAQRREQVERNAAAWAAGRAETTPEAQIGTVGHRAALDRADRLAHDLDLALRRLAQIKYLTDESNRAGWDVAGERMVVAAAIRTALGGPVDVRFESAIVGPSGMARPGDAAETTTDRPLCPLCGSPDHKPTPEGWQVDVMAERARQREKWGDDHDREHGPDHLLTLAIDYGRRGEAVKSAALVQAARDLLAAGRAETTNATDEDDPQTTELTARQIATSPKERTTTATTEDARKALEAHRLIGARCRCGMDPRLDYHRYEGHVAQALVDAGLLATTRVWLVRGADEDAKAFLSDLAARLPDERGEV